MERRGVLKDGCKREIGQGDCKKGALWDLRGNQKKKGWGMKGGDKREHEKGNERANERRN